MWSVRTQVLAVVIGALGTVPKGLESNLKRIGTNTSSEIIQKTAFLGTARFWNDESHDKIWVSLGNLLLPGPQEDNPDPTFGKAGAESTIISLTITITITTFCSICCITAMINIYVYSGWEVCIVRKCVQSRAAFSRPRSVFHWTDQRNLFILFQEGTATTPATRTSKASRGC